MGRVELVCPFLQETKVGSGVENYPGIPGVSSLIWAGRRNGEVLRFLTFLPQRDTTRELVGCLHTEGM